MRKRAVVLADELAASVETRQLLQEESNTMALYVKT